MSEPEDQREAFGRAAGSALAEVFNKTFQEGMRKHKGINIDDACPDCMGTGIERITFYWNSAHIKDRIDCQKCKGKGKG